MWVWWIFGLGNWDLPGDNLCLLGHYGEHGVEGFAWHEQKWELNWMNERRRRMWYQWLHFRTLWFYMSTWLLSCNRDLAERCDFNFELFHFHCCISTFLAGTSSKLTSFFLNATKNASFDSYEGSDKLLIMEIELTLREDSGFSLWTDLNIALSCLSSSLSSDPW